MNNENIDFEVIEEEFAENNYTDEGERGKIISAKETAEMLGMTPRNIRYLAKEGKIPYQTRRKGKKLLYLFNREDVGKYKSGKEVLSFNEEGKRETGVLSSAHTTQQVLYPSQYEAMQKEIRELYMELGKWKEKTNNHQYILEERAQSLYEKEAKIKEIEAKHEEEKKEIERKNEEEKRRLEEDFRQIREEAERAKKDHQEERLKVENERKEKEELMKQLILLNMPWWKKFLHTKEKLEEEIQKKLKS